MGSRWRYLGWPWNPRVHQRSASSSLGFRVALLCLQCESCCDRICSYIRCYGRGFMKRRLGPCRKPASHSYKQSSTSFLSIVYYCTHRRTYSNCCLLRAVHENPRPSELCLVRHKSSRSPGDGRSAASWIWSILRVLSLWPSVCSLFP